MKKNNIMWGLVFIIIGVLIGIKSLGILDINLLFDGWWSLIIIVPCFIGLFTDTDKTGSIIGILIGVFLLLAAQNILSYDLIWKLALPVILIIMGLSMMFKNGKKEKEIKVLDSEKVQEYFTCFSGQDIDYGKKEFLGADLTSIFGGIKLDLSNSKIKEDVKINAGAIFGGIEIKVPENINVIVDSLPIFGGVTNKIKNKEEYKNTIFIEASALFGGVKIYDKNSKDD